MSSVRPFPARVVRPELARAMVMAMSDSLDESGVDLMGVTIDPTAYVESAASLYVYRQRRGDAAYTGVVCETAMQAVADGRVRGHEAVHQLRVDALVWHHERTHAPPAPVLLLHRAGAEFTRAVQETTDTAPILDFAGPRGLQQTVWRVPEGPATAVVTDELAAADLYIADGHHRVAAGLEEWRLSGKPADAGLLCVVYPMDGLRLSAFHRRVSGPVRAADLLALLAPEFQVRAVPGPPAPSPGSMGLYVGRSWYAVTYEGSRGEGRAGLDAAILQTLVLDRLGQPRAGRAGIYEAVPDATRVDELTQWCDADEGALFTLAPPPSEALTSVADAGEVMPPKTTYFTPKPCAGIFLRP